MNESGNSGEDKAQNPEGHAACQDSPQHMDKPVETMKAPGSPGSQELQNPEQPKFGQRRQLDYGAMKSQFPADYNPYVFGRPEPDRSENKQQDSEQQHGFTSRFPFGGSRGEGDRDVAPQSGGAGYSRQNGSYSPRESNQQTADGHIPDVHAGIDMNDPNQNPLWGRWSAMSIFAFVISLLGGSYLGLILGVVSIRRTRLYHMRGRGLAIAAVVISILLIIVNIWLMANPEVLQNIISQMYDMAGGSGSLDTSGAFGA